jgi:HNH endonuclease
MGRHAQPTEQRFWAKVDRTGSEDACWNWTGSRCGLRYEYGRTTYNQKTIMSHRLAWILTNGEIPAGTCVLHHCDNPACCNARHLFIDKTAKKRNNAPRGESAGLRKLTEEQVRSIRQLIGEGITQREIAKRFDVSQVAIVQINKRRTWKCVE